MSRVRLEIDGGAATLTLDAAGEGNRLGAAMFADLSAAVDTLANRDDLRVVLLRAEGDHFCVGGAIDEFAATGDLRAHLAETLPAAHRMILTLAGLPCPVISALQGSVAGGGIGLALCADIVLAAETCIFRAGYPAIGLSPDLGSSYQLLHRAGPTFATEALMSNRRVPAQEALAQGLITRLHSAADLDAEAARLRDRLAQGPTTALSALRRLTGPDLREMKAHLDREAEAMLTCAATDDARRGIGVFLNRTTAAFTGH